MEATTPEFEAALGRLLQSYSKALKSAGDLPAVGRCRVRVFEARLDELDDPLPAQDEFRTAWRWVARFPARLYVETHIRRQLRHLARCVDDELLSELPLRGEDRLFELREHIGRRTGRLLSWTTLRDVFVRIPPVAAALPLFATAVSDPLSITGWDDLVRSVVVLAISALLVYLFFVWPSVRLGFRVKRAIFSGGVDQARPFLHKPGKVVWLGVPPPREIQESTVLDRGAERIGRGIERLTEAVAGWASTRRTAPRASVAGITTIDTTAAQLATHENPQAADVDATEGGATVERSPGDPAAPRPFPATAVYRDENVVFAQLGRRKRDEPPLGWLLSLSFYVILMIGLAMPALWLDYLTSGEVETGTAVGFGVFMLMVDLLAIQLGLQAWRNYRYHLRRWEQGQTDGDGRPDAWGR